MSSLRTDGNVLGHLRANIAVTVFVESNAFLDFYIDACKAIVQKGEQLCRVSVGTLFLTGLFQVLPSKLIHQVGMFSPYFMQKLASNNARTALQSYQKASSSAIFAANLCGSFRNQSQRGFTMNDVVYNRVIDHLLKHVQVNRDSLIEP